VSGIGWLTMSGGGGQHERSCRVVGRAEALQLLAMKRNKKAAKPAHPEPVEGGGLPYGRRMRLPRAVGAWGSGMYWAVATTVVF
jgi:hypothetical protein